MGYVYPHGKDWWMQYFVDGERKRESTGVPRSAPQRLAENVLKRREGKVAEGQLVLPRLDQILWNELAEDLRRHYRTSRTRDLREAEKRLRPLDAAFRGRRAATISSTDLAKYVETRQAQGLSNSTINRELSMLGRVFRFAATQDPPKVARVPVLRFLKEPPPRAGFFETEPYAAVRRWLRPEHQLACDLACTFGWRIYDEVLTLEWRQVDFAAGTIRLDVGHTKGGEGRVVYLTPALAAGLQAQRERIRALERKLGRIIPFVFAHTKNGRRYKAGDRIRDFRKAWLRACLKAGLATAVRDAQGRVVKITAQRLRHDFRRTAARNLINDGTPERVAMQILGHRTSSIFKRYHIVAPEDLKAATERIARRSHRNSHNSPTPQEMVLPN